MSSACKRFRKKIKDKRAQSAKRSKLTKRAKRSGRIKKEKLEIYAFTRRLYYLLRHHIDHIQFQKLPLGDSGYYYPEIDEIILDHRRDIISTLIHEVLHKWHPGWSETKVLKKEKWFINEFRG